MMQKIVPVGFRRDGRPVWPIAGGSGDVEDGDAAVEGAPVDDGEAETPPAEASPLEQQAQQAIDELRQAGQEVPQALERAVREFRDARREAANYRVQSREQQEQQAEAMKSLAKAFGIDVADDQPPDPQDLQQRIERYHASERQARVELAAYRSAGRQGADADALLDSRTFMDRVAALDPDADDFGEQLDAAVAASLEANPKLKTSPGGGSNGRGPAQGARSSARRESATLEEAVNHRLSHQPAR